jgi:hypothetical protein
MITTVSVPKSMGVEVAIQFFSFKQPDSARPRAFKALNAATWLADIEC